MQFASHQDIICSLKPRALPGRKIDTPDDFSSAHHLLNEAFNEVHEARHPSMHTESPFILLPNALRLNDPLFENTTFSFRRKTRTYTLWVYSDKSAILGFQDEGQGGIRIVPWGFHLASTLETKDQFINMRLRGGSPHIGYTGHKVAGITPLFNQDHNIPIEALQAKRAYKHHLRKDMMALVAAMEKGAPLAHRLSDKETWNDPSRVIPYFVTYEQPDTDLSGMELFLNRLGLYLHMKDPELRFLQYFIYGRNVLSGGHLADARVHIHQDGEPILQDVVEWIEEFLRQDTDILPRIDQISQTQSGPSIIALSASGGPQDSTAHELIEAARFIEELMRKHPLPGTNIIERLASRRA